MPEPTPPRAATSTTRPQPVLNGSAPPRRPGPAVPRHRGLRTRISGMRVALVMAAARTARITQLRQVMRRDRRKSNAG